MKMRSNWLLVVIIGVLVGLLGAVSVVAQDAPITPSPAPVDVPIELADMPNFAANWQVLVTLASVVWFMVELVKPSLKQYVTVNNTIIQVTALGIAFGVSVIASRVFHAYPFGETAQANLWAAFVTTVIAVIGHAIDKRFANKPSAPVEAVRG